MKYFESIDHVLYFAIEQEQVAVDFYIEQAKNAEIKEVKDINKRRQELPVTYKLNGAIYLAKISFFKESKTFLDSNTFC